jgi:hypothetical protein
MLSRAPGVVNSKTTLGGESSAFRCRSTPAHEVTSGAILPMHCYDQEKADLMVSIFDSYTGKVKGEAGPPERLTLRVPLGSQYF